ncbi:alpha/beta hydrolase [Mycolicibacterium confluentis]|uniref:DUF1023 domain-containing protein n=1 Tax=Mycolicibacterium confluentis TaxID=28047 RepID=A0A7I7XWX2_9MYCO|nr:alpha/beta hydrolase [Mycolicibacterium confluentis]MCV7321975.1 alpha/beta hydrolase [Mycolicibacterium confluentis]ORV32216.1 hypothetical protein AWB99_11275 [Mycolicibacterium confluentis]BBZ33798.1 hypothetical protein MCNF_24030 [Mycolicibacterium confluentis]
MTPAPTVSEVEHWRPSVLHEVAEAWSVLALALRRHTEGLARNDGDAWSGTAAEAAFAQLAGRVERAHQLAQALASAAVEARRGGQELITARGTLVAVLQSVRSLGCVVDDAGVVSAAAPRFGSADDWTAQVQTALQRAGAADHCVAAAIREALGVAFGEAPTDPVRAPAAPNTAPAATDVVAAWPTMSQDRIAAQISAMTPEQRAALIAGAPRQVGNTDGVPWPMRVAANEVNIADAVAAQRRILDRPENEKIREALAQGFGQGLRGAGGFSPDRAAAERFQAMVLTDPAWRAAAIAHHDRAPRRNIAFYGELTAVVPDPTGRSAEPVKRQVLAFDPARSSLVELHGDLSRATSLAVLVPGLNTTVQESDSNVRTARRFVAAGGGDVAMITYLGGPFPTGGDVVSGVLDAAQSRYALDMAPRLVAFSEDVERTVDATGRNVPVTYLGHSYGGSILGTAERLGLTADRTVYVAAAGAGVGVEDQNDWHNRNPDVERYSMTAPGDWIEVVQGRPGSPHGADPDEMAGVWRLSTGRRLDGTEMSGPRAHSDIVNEPSDAWHNLLAVITGRPVVR